MFNYILSKMRWLGLWFLDHVLGTYAALGILIFAGGFASAATGTYDARNVPDMALYKFINETQETGIQVSWPFRNNVQQPFPGSGGVILVSQGGKLEHIYFSDVVNNTSLKTFTLTGTVIRDLSWDNCTAYVSNSDGQQFSRTAKVQLVDDCRLFNFAFKKDQANVCTASGCVQFTGSGSLRQPTFATEADRDRNLGAIPQVGLSACTIDTGLCYDGLGGAWVARGSNATPNATTTVSGKVELTASGDILNGTEIGDSGAPLVLGADLLARNSSGATNKIPVLGSGGVMTGSQLGTGDATSETILYGDNTWGLPVSSMYFGDASDGDVVIATGSTVNLSGDVEYNNLTISSGAILNPNGYRIWVKGTLTMLDGNGSKTGIVSNGGAGGAGGAGGSPTAGTAGAAGTLAHAAGTLPASKAGVAGGAGAAGRTCNGGNNSGNAGAAGTTGTAETQGIGGTGAAGAKGGDNESITNVGATTGTSAASGGSATISNAKIMFNALLQMMSWPTARDFNGSGVSAGGSGGTGGSTNSFCGSGNSGGGGGGGGSGANGGNIDIYVNVMTGSGYIQANGGVGGIGGASFNSVTSNAGDGGGGGGGGGGAGGTINLFYRTQSSWSGIVQALGGAGAVGGTGNSGQTGSTGSTGLDGQTLTYQIR